MTVNESIIGALSPLGLPVVPDIYTGEETCYFTFNYDLVPVQFAGNRPIWWKALVQVHLFAPLGENLLSRRGESARALVGAGYTWPEIIDATDKDAQHYVFECEMLTSDERMNDYE